MSKPRTWRISLPLDKPLSLNDRRHWRAKATETKNVRLAAQAAALLVGVPRLDTCSVRLVYVPRDNRRRDSDNLVATLKPACDGLVDAHVVPDDTPAYMTKHMPTIAPAGPADLNGSRLHLYITEGL